MTTIRQQSPLLPAVPRFPAPPNLIPKGIGESIGGALRDVFADNHSSYKGKLRGMDDKGLSAEARRCQQTVTDASAGGDKNSGAVSRAKAQLAEVKQEQAARAGFAKSSDPAWQKKTHCLNDSQLGTERARQLERYHEATTGYDRDPKKAADAKSKLDFLNKESFGRVVDRFQGELPKATPTKPTSLVEHVGDYLKYQSMKPEQLAAEKGKLTATLRDATTGPHRDVQLAANTRQKLDVINHCQQPNTKPVSHDDVKKYQKDLEHCSSRELRHQHEGCRREERECHDKGDKVGESNWRRKGEICEGAIVRHRGELSDCQRRVGGMSDKQLGDYGKDLDKQLRDPSNAKRRGELCEYQQICRHEQHERLCDRHFPGTEPVPSPDRPADEQLSIADLLKEILQGGERFGEATTGVDQSPADARSALQDLERDLKQLLEQLSQFAQ